VIRHRPNARLSAQQPDRRDQIPCAPGTVRLIPCPRSNRHHGRPATANRNFPAASAAHLSQPPTQARLSGFSTGKSGALTVNCARSGRYSGVGQAGKRNPDRREASKPQTVVSSSSAQQPTGQGLSAPQGMREARQRAPFPDIPDISARPRTRGSKRLAGAGSSKSRSRARKFSRGYRGGWCCSRSRRLRRAGRAVRWR
jgi:hypothetical protein